MGYSISQEQSEKLAANKRAGRLCAMSTRGGGCFTRATTKVVQESWAYKIGEGPMTVHPMVYCAAHAKTMPAGFEGTNFRVISQERLAK